jgi:hypothetical protein
LSACRRLGDPELFVDGQRIAGFVAIFGGGATADPQWEQLTPVSGSSIVRSTVPCSRCTVRTRPSLASRLSIGSLPASSSAEKLVMPSSRGRLASAAGDVQQQVVVLALERAETGSAINRGKSNV